jgi:hypothetical protein
MPVFEIQTPDGKTFEVDAPNEQAAMQALQGMIKPQKPSQSGYWSMADEAMDFVSGGLMTKGNAAIGGLVDAGFGAIRGDGWNYSDNYNENLNQLRQAQADYGERNPIRSTIGKGAGLALGITQMPVWGKGLAGAAGTGTVYGGIMGAGSDAESIPERASNALTGAATGAGIGGLGYGLGSLIGMGANKASRAWEAVNADPQTRAAIELRSLAADAGGPMAVRQSLDNLGPDAVLADVLGERGRALTRQSANISPDARETIEAALLGRKGMQNQRVVSDIEQIAGLPVGSTKTVDDLVEGTYQKLKPGVDDAYTAARAAGKDMPLQFFDDVLSTSQGQQVLKEAEAAVGARARLRGAPDDVSNLAIVDEMKKIFDSKATSAFASGDRAAGGLWRDFAASLRTRADALMDMAETPIYAGARNAARYSNQAQEAVKLGAELGGPRVPVNLPGRVEGVDLGNRQRVAQGYAAKKTDTLLNRNNTEGAVNEFYTPQGKKAADAALGPGALDKTLAREKAFNQTVKALTGNSTTARQLVEMGLGTGAAATLVSGDSMTGGIAGILGALARKGAPAIARKITSDAQQKTAPLIAQALLAKDLPAQAMNMAPGMLERLSRADRDKLTKMLLLLTEQAQRPPPQPSASR